MIPDIFEELCYSTYRVNSSKNMFKCTNYFEIETKSILVKG